MERLPLLVSVPAAGLSVPAELSALNRLTPAEIAADGDEGARAIYAILKTEVARFVSTDVARAFVDLNRTGNDFGRDGVVKTHTRAGRPAYDAPLQPQLVERLLRRYYHPYHRRLSELAGQRVALGLDCHTMFAVGPPTAPDCGRERPQVCLGDGGGACPADWMEKLRICFQAHFPGEVTVNRPFSGGYITRSHGREMPWVQLELSRGAFAEPAQKALWVLESLRAWAVMMGFSVDEA